MKTVSIPKLMEKGDIQMGKYKIKPTNVENVMRDNDFIVSKTDLKGTLTYVNQTFIEFAKYDEQELLGKPHSMIRHPDMPRVIFQLLWDTIQQKKEMNAYVKNLSGDGSYYWVFANVTPVMNEFSKIVGYYSVRRKPKKESLDKIIKLYALLSEEEKKYPKGEDVKRSSKLLENYIKEQGVSYEKFIINI
ncbi:MAG: PAS domain-containing protein [Melioribacteraceae bacterium]|nr:PAS domain-containing protein [Melioribacteraceae bacterium]